MIRFLKYIWYFICGWPCRFFCLVFFRIRFYGIENVPKKGGFILLCNHQCWLDPMFVVVPVNRICVFAARDSLVKSLLFGWVFRLYSCIPIRRNHADVGAIRDCIEKLEKGYGLVLYPEGTRTSDGRITRLKPGFSVLAKRAAVPIVPVVIDGAFEAWPRHQIMFSPGKVWIQYGKPMMPNEINQADNSKFVAALTAQMRQMQTELRKKAGKAPFDYEGKPVLVEEDNASISSPDVPRLAEENHKINYIWYCLWRAGCRVFCRVFFRPQAFNLDRVPKKDGFLLLSNHQSFLDPMLNANPISRQCCFAARSTLFDIPVLGRLFHSFNAIPIKRGEADLAAMRMFLEKLRDGYGLVLYPEATRTRDGKIAEIKPGFSLLARKANVPIIPSVIDGAYEAWPRHKKLFSSRKVYVTYGQPIPPAKIIELGDREFAKYLTKILRDMQAELRLRVGRKPFNYEEGAG